MGFLIRRCIVFLLEENNYIFLCLARNYMVCNFRNYELLPLSCLCLLGGSNIPLLCLIMFYIFKDYYGVVLVNFCLRTWGLCS